MALMSADSTDFCTHTGIGSHSGPEWGRILVLECRQRWEQACVMAVAGPGSGSVWYSMQLVVPLVFMAMLFGLSLRTAILT
jgi:hypothetical protein